MTSSIETYREYARENGLTFYRVPGGCGVRFSDGFDVFWVLPDERWHFLNRPEAFVDTSYFHELNQRRERVVDAIRRYLAKQGVAAVRNSNGHWWCTVGGMSTEFSVGADLTRTLTNESDLVVAMRSAFEGSFIKAPSERRAERHLEEFGQVLEEVPLPEETRTVLDLPETPLVALGWMGLCKAMKHDSSFESPEAFVAAAAPKGRIERALLQVAQRLSTAKASVELSDGSMCIRFSDDFDSYKNAPKSQQLRDLLHAMEPEQAGDNLADEYERLNAARGRVLNAVFGTLSRHGYFLDSNVVLQGLEVKTYVGREVREFVIEFGEGLTEAIESSGDEFAVRHMLSSEEALATEAIALLGRSDGDVRLVKRSLRPIPPPRLELPELTAEQIALLDGRSELLLRKFMETREALTARQDSLQWDAAIDSWADAQQWQDLARKHSGGDYPHGEAEKILTDGGDVDARDRFMARIKESEPHHEVPDQEVEMVWRLRGKIPELAAKWFGPQQYDDVPFAEVRARLGDPIGVCHVLGGISTDDDHEIVPRVLKDVPPALVPFFVEGAQIEKWREAALRWADETTEWNWGGGREVLAVAANMGWPEVFDRLATNPFLLTGLLQTSDDDPGVLFADKLFLAWSKLAPSPFLMRVVGYVLSLDLERVSESLARRFMGSADLLKKHPAMAGEISDAWLSNLGVALAISWHRCRKRVPH